MKQKITVNDILPARLSGSYIEFLRSFLSYKHYIPVPKVWLPPEEILLFNPGYSSDTLLYFFLEIFSGSFIENNIGDLFQKQFSVFNWYENPYFFVINKENKHEDKASDYQILNQGGIMFQMNHNIEMSVTLSEMMLYHLFLQWQGKPTATPDCIVVTQTRVFHEALNDDVLVTMGLDRDLIETRIDSYSAPALIGENVIFKETYRLPA